MKKIFQISIFALFISSLFLPFRIGADTGSTVAFLKSSISDAWNIQALLAAGESGIDLKALETVSGTLANDYAKAILALTAAGKDPAIFGNIDYIKKLETYYIDGQFGDLSLLNDDFWSILALCSAGGCDQADIGQSKDFIISKQNPDGGWGYAVGGESDTNDTAAAIMALNEAGVPAASQAIAKALEYLQGAQNDDGGFGWASGSASDSGSDAWVILALNKLGIDSAAWTKNGNNPKAHLLSLQDPDGGFWWVEPGSSDFNNKAMTPFAAIAVLGKTFPLGYFKKADGAETGYAVRIEGAHDSICNTKAEGASVLEVVKNAAVKCHYTYQIENTSFGPYLKRINSEEASGQKGWMFFVNNESPSVGMADYELVAGDEVLLYYGDWGWQPSRLMSSKKTLASNEKIIFSASYFANREWQVLAGAKIFGLGEAGVTDEKGEFELAPADGVYNVWLEKEGFVRSAKLTLTVGGGSGKSIKLSAEIEAVPVVAGEALIFSVSPETVSFGKLKPGQKKSQIINLKNSGTVDLSLRAKVEGDRVFQDFIKLGDSAWPGYASEIFSGQSRDLEVIFDLPAAYLGSGVKSGDLIVWATPK